jgi:DNA-binding GntR family transcriptional regulator
MTSTVNSATLAESIASALRSAIVGGQYVCGERMVELSIARAMSVSQNTVRDALRILEQEGWVVKHTRRGVYVRSFTPDEAAEIYALLGAVESLALGWAMVNLNKTLMAELRQPIALARRQALVGEWNAAVESLFLFHETLGRIARKPLTGELLIRLYNQARLLEALRQARAPRTAAELNAQVAAHEALLKTVESGDIPAAQAALRDYLTHYCTVLLPTLTIA